jgi:hypothetical protein
MIRRLVLSYESNGLTASGGILNIFSKTWTISTFSVVNDSLGTWQTPMAEPHYDRKHKS